MAQTYTLEEAAQRLGLTQEDFKRRIKDEWKSVRSFRDGPTLRFRSTDIDELARMLGEASDPGLQLGAVDASSELDVADASDHFSFTDDDLAPAPSEPASPQSPSTTPPAADLPLLLDSDDDFAFDFNDPPPSSVRVEQTGSDSNVKVDPPSGSGRHKHPIPGAGSHPTDEIHLDLSGPRSSVMRPPGASKNAGGTASGNLSGPKSQKLPSPLSGKIPGPTPGAVNPEDGSSEFELSLDSDSDSFELKLGSDESDEVDIGLDLSPPPGADRGGLSGINLGRPADSGISLERPSGMIGKSGSKIPAHDEEDLDFDLSMDAGEEDLSGPKTSHRMASPKSGDLRGSSIDSDSEFELALDDNSGVVDSLSEDLMGPRTASGDASQGDIFETDFEIPAMDDDSESEVIAVDEDDLTSEGETSDFDLAISDDDAPAYDESGSEVVVVDDELELVGDDGVIVEEDAIGYDDLDAGVSASRALQGLTPGDDYDDEVMVESGGPVRTVEAPPAPWGPLPALVLLPCLLLVFIGSLMSFELLRSMWGYHQPSPPGNVIVRGMAGAMGFQTKD